MESAPSVDFLFFKLSFSALSRSISVLTSSDIVTSIFLVDVGCGRKASKLSSDPVQPSTFGRLHLTIAPGFERLLELWCSPIFNRGQAWFSQAKSCFLCDRHGDTRDLHLDGTKIIPIGEVESFPI